MSNLKLLSKILRLQSLKITEFWFKNGEQELHLAVKPYKNGCRCPTCGRRGRIVGYIRVSQLMKCPDEACFIAVSTYLTGYATGSESVQEPTVR